MKTRIIVVALAVLMVFAMVSCKEEPVHEHVFDQEVVKDEYLAEKATEQSAAKYYKSCTCGAKGEETFESGTKLDHEFGGWVVSKKATCTESGEETRECIHEGCNATETQKIPAIGHDFGDDGKCRNEGCTVVKQARIGNVYYDTLTEAIKSLKDAESKTAEIAVYGDVKLENFSTITGSSDNSAYNITFVGSGKDKTSIDIATDSTLPPTEANHPNYIEGASLSFKDLTVVIGDGSNYQGFVRAASLGFEGCAIVGMGTYWGNGDVIFKECEFKDNGNYSLWLYTGKNYVFEDCTFTSSIGKFLHPYNEGSLNLTIMVKNCSFENTSEDSADAKPVLNIKTQVVCTVLFEGNIELKNIATGKQGSKYFQLESDNGSVIKIDGEQVYPNV